MLNRYNVGSWFNLSISFPRGQNRRTDEVNEKMTSHLGSMKVNGYYMYDNENCALVCRGVWMRRQPTSSRQPTAAPVSTN